jgi:cupin fold WbuC family metalloprotein
MLNAVEPGTVVPIHRHPTKDESFVILRGKVRVTTHGDDGSIIEDVVLSQESGGYGVDILKNVWHRVESLATESVIFECKEGPFVVHEVEGILGVKSEGCD